MNASLCGKVYLAIAISFGLGVPPSALFGQAGSSGSIVFSPDSSPYGISYPEWTTKWWTWFISSPTDENPINDATGARCAENQSGPVWFLVGSGGGKAERSCTIPAGKAILIPNIIIECSYAEDQSLKNEADLVECAKSGMDITTKVWATIDGTDLPASEIYRVKSQTFNFTFPDKNVFSAPAGQTQGVSDGWWTLIKPLPPGKHEIHVGGLQVDYTVTTPSNFLEDSTYHLTVEGSLSNVITESVNIAGEPITIQINTTSSVSDFEFDEKEKQISFKVSGEDGTPGSTTLSIGRILNGPYTVMIDGNMTTDYETSEEKTTGETSIRLVYTHSTHDVVITGTSVVPEFQYSSTLILLAAISVIVILGSKTFSSRVKFWSTDRKVGP